MIPLPRPSVTTREAYLACLEMVRDPATKEAYEAAIEFIEQAESQFEQHAQRLDLHLLNVADFRPEGVNSGTLLKITSKDLSEKLYDDRMAHPKSSGRKIYDQIKLAAPNDACPLCGIRRVSTLDHYLPKAHFATLSVTPLNLIPACSECNKVKLDVAPTRKEEQTLFPYFEDVSEAQWIQCSVIAEKPAILRFTVSEPAHCSRVLINRVRHHFEVFKLGELYSHHANNDLASIRWLLRKLFDQLGDQGVRTYLRDHAESARKVGINSWKVAMYEALAESEWYCTGGFDAQAI
ncbi:HNH endonuclease [Streptomyces sp. G7(2002)]|uniref:HNH endonuclease n=1 Tax=Streptomyces sp. G7(2002) TaxID=2971798 RepID=UPI00237DC20E|nr:hypothetical protein [Streptomyces sp. G7(2002)]WDT56497.1 hypothetical protein NUT86_21910 [Streptomyces sp. G7(2002)]